MITKNTKPLTLIEKCETRKGSGSPLYWIYISAFFSIAVSLITGGIGLFYSIKAYKSDKKHNFCETEEYLAKTRIAAFFSFALILAKAILLRNQ